MHLLHTPIRYMMLCGVGLSVLGGTGVVCADGPRVLLIDDQFNASQGRLIQLTAEGITVEYPSGTRGTLAAGSVLAMVAIDGPIDPQYGIGTRVAADSAQSARSRRIARTLAATRHGFVETTRGLRFPGSISPTAANGESLAWEHPLAGRIELALDDISRLVTPIAASDVVPIRRSSDSDELVLSNGDVLAGFLLSIGPTTSIETSTGNIIDLPIDRVAAALLANPKLPMTGTMIWLDDGSTFAAEALTATGSDGYRVTLPGGNTVEYDPQTLRAIAFEAAGILPLSDLLPQSQQPVGDRVFADPIRTVRHPDDLAFGSSAVLNALDIEMPGPMRVSWTLPPGVLRFAGTAALVDTTGGWGDCEYSIWLDGELVFSTRLFGEQPVASFNVETQGAVEMVLVLDPGNFGPVRDRVVLHRPLLQIER